MSDIDAMIAEAFPQPEAQSQTVAENDTPVLKNDTDATQEPVESQHENNVDNDGDDVVFPKKAVNAISRRDRQIGKQKAELSQLRAEIARFQAMQQQPQQAQPQAQTPKQSNGEPNIADYDNHIDYLEARAEWKLEQKLKERDTRNEESTQRARLEQYKVERESHINQTAEKFFSEVPDAKTTLEEYGDVIRSLPDGIVGLLYEADNAPLVLYNLAKSGKIEDLENMSLAKAAFEIGRAEAQIPQKPKTKAPAPLPTLRGSAQGIKNLADMSPEEALKQLGIY